MATVKTGFGASKITPERGVLMAGYFEERRSTATHDDLYAKAMIFDDGETSAGILCCDLICLQKDEVVKIRDIVSKKNWHEGRKSDSMRHSHAHGTLYAEFPDR